MGFFTVDEVKKSRHFVIGDINNGGCKVRLYWTQYTHYGYTTRTMRTAHTIHPSY